jgi:hypothetical protein
MTPALVIEDDLITIIVRSHLGGSLGILMYRTNASRVIFYLGCARHF